MKLTLTYKNGNQLTFEKVEWINFKDNAIEFFEKKGISFIHGYGPVRITLNNIVDFRVEK